MKNDGTIESLTAFIIDYFENDYLIIKDFLTSKSPWDNQICFLLKITPTELEKVKSKIISSMFFKYSYDIITPLSMDDNSSSYCLPDLLITEKIQKIKLELAQKNKLNLDELTEKLATLINNNNFTFVQMIKYNIEVLKEMGYDLKENTRNKFIFDIQNIYDLYETLKSKYLLSYEKKHLDIFYNKLEDEMKKYLYQNFRSRAELAQFVKYLISVAYSYIKYEEQNKMEINDLEYDLVEVIEHNENLDELFFSENNFMIDILEIIHSMYFNLGQYFDTRNKVSNKNDIFSSLDNNFNVYNSQYIAVESILTEVYLEKVLNSFYEDGFTINEIFSYLMDCNKSIYDRLFNNDLDPRLEEYYKIVLIKKILVGVYEYEFYLLTVKKEQVSYYSGIKLLNFKDNSEIINYFSDNYLALIEKYFEYKHVNKYISERAMIEIYKSNELKEIDLMNKYAISRYIPIFAKKLVQLQSVDYMNMYISAIVNEQNEYSVSEKINMINCISINIYENILAGRIEGPIIDEMRLFLENNSSPAETLLCNENLLKRFQLLFVKLNNSISYSSESSLRSRIDSKNKILKKLNPFNE